MGLSLEDAKEEDVVSVAPPEAVGCESLKNCFVGTFLTTSVVSFPSMRATLANVCHLIRGITITYLLGGIYLFRLYHRVDADRIEARGHGILILIC